MLRTCRPDPGPDEPSIEEGRRLNAGRAVATVSPPVVRDARVVSRERRADGARHAGHGGADATCGCSTGRKGALTRAHRRASTSPTRSASRSPVKDAPSNARFQLVADNPRGHYQSDGAVARPRSRTVTIKVSKKNGLTITGVVKGLARAHIRKVELLVGKGSKAQKAAAIGVDRAHAAHGHAVDDGALGPRPARRRARSYNVSCCGSPTANGRHRRRPPVRVRAHVAVLARAVPLALAMRLLLAAPAGAGGGADEAPRAC